MKITISICDVYYCELFIAYTGVNKINVDRNAINMRAPNYRSHSISMTRLRLLKLQFVQNKLFKIDRNYEEEEKMGSVKINLI